MPADRDVVEFLNGVPRSIAPDRLRSCDFRRVDGHPAVIATWSLEDGRVARQVVIAGKKRAVRARVVHAEGREAATAAGDFTDSLHLLED